ncbi:MAG: hypothetical protein AB9836_06090 [Aminipila sp.]
MPESIRGFKVIYKDIVYKGLSMRLDFGNSIPKELHSQLRPKFIEMCVIDSDGQPLILNDEAFMFQLVRDIN